jgi:hypothetical protein
MKNAHLRMGTLQFTKVLRDTTIDVSVRMYKRRSNNRPRNVG